MSETNQHGAKKAESPVFRLMQPSSKYRQTVIWMVLPNGRDVLPQGRISENKKLKLSVAIAPRLQVLDSNGFPARDGMITLDPGFPDFINWPAWINTTLLWNNKFEIEFRPVAGPRNTRLAAATVVSANPVPGLWQAVFPKDTVVRTFIPQDSLNHYISELQKLRYTDTIDAYSVEQFLRRLYSNIALDNVVTPPPISKLIDPTCLGSFITPADRLQGLQSLITGTQKRALGTRSVFGLQPEGPTQTMGLSIQMNLGQGPGAAPRLLPLVDKAAVESSFRRYFEKQPPTTHKPIARRKIERYDFHHIISLVRDYPEVLRWLGLVIDLEVDDPGFQEEVKQKGMSLDVRLVHPNLGSIGTSKLNPRPWTRCVLSPEFFVAQSSDAALQNGMLAFGNKDLFKPAELDTDGTTRKNLMSANSIASEQARGSGDAGQSYPISSMRTTGLGMLMTDRVTRQIQKLQSASDLETKLALEVANDDFALRAEHIMRGFRVDVGVKNGQDGTLKWYSLCRRKMEYHFGSTVLPGKEPDEEGTVTTALFKDDTKTTQDKNTGQEQETYEMLSTLFKWDGWSSLCVPRPGGESRRGPDRENGSSEGVDPSLAGLFMKAIPSTAPGTLPPLRFGRKYRFRARIVDLAGNSLPPDMPDDTHASEEIVFRRFEPVATPILIAPRRARTSVSMKAGSNSSKPQLVSYSPGESLETMVIRSNYNESMEISCSRMIAAPLVPASFVVFHGKFDATLFFLSKTENMQSFLDNQKENRIKQGIEIRGKNVNYLFDPLAAGITLGNMPGSKNIPDDFPKSVEKYCYDPDSSQDTCLDKWPDTSVLELRIEEGKEPPSYGGNVITVYLPKAEKIDITYSSLIRPENLEQMSLWKWIEEEHDLQKSHLESLVKRNAVSGANPPTSNDLMAMMNFAKRAAAMGLHWMLTPSRTITLVHAVRQPLKEPVLTPVFDPSARMATMRRDLNATWSPMDFIIGVHGKSTGKVDMMAQWDEITPDADSGQGVKRTPVTQHVFQADVHLDGSDATATGGGLVCFTAIPGDDTGALFCGAFIDRAVVRVKPELANDVATRNPSALQVAQRLNLGPRWKNVSPAKLAKIESPHHEFGDTKHRKINYLAVGSTRFREYFLPMREAGSLNHRKKQEGLTEKEEKQFMRSGPQVTVHIPSSARPSPLKVAYIVPSFDWEPLKKGNNTLSRKRRGNGLRVYLDGDWYSSGEDEMLGVIHIPDGASADERYKPYITQWGLDPLWEPSVRTGLGNVGNISYQVAGMQSAPLPESYPTTSHFIGGLETAHGLSLHEVEESSGISTISVTGYAVNYDKDKKLWYADIRMDPAYAYFPFVRLALVRYQPYSVKGAHLSPVAIADFAQLLPDRTATVAINTTDRRGNLDIKIHIEVHGACSWYNQKPGTAVTTMVCTLEKANDAISDKTLQWGTISNPGARSMPPLPTTKLNSEEEGNGSYRWSGSLPLARKRGDEKYRLVVKEYDAWENIGDDLVLPGARRILYADAFELDQIGY